VEPRYDQKQVELVVRNEGKVQADNLLVEVKVIGGWIHGRWVWMSVQGPFPPARYETRTMLPDLPQFPRTPGRHEVVVSKSKVRSIAFKAACEDFRPDTAWKFDGVLCIDPYARKTEVSLSITAANFKG
jgi:hypothetical protein